MDLVDNRSYLVTNAELIWLVCIEMDMYTR